MNSPENIASAEALEKRTLADAELIKGGAKFKDQKGGASLDVTGEQVEDAKQEMELEFDLPPEQLKEKKEKYIDALKGFFDESTKNQSSKAGELVYNAVKEALLNADRTEFTSYPTSDTHEDVVDRHTALIKAKEEWTKIARGLFSGTENTSFENDARHERLGFLVSKITESKNPDRVKKVILEILKGNKKRFEELLETV